MIKSLRSTQLIGHKDRNSCIFIGSEVFLQKVDQESRSLFIYMGSDQAVRQCYSSHGISQEVRNGDQTCWSYDHPKKKKVGLSERKFIKPELCAFCAFQSFDSPMVSL